MVEYPFGILVPLNNDRESKIFIEFRSLQISF